MSIKIYNVSQDKVILSHVCLSQTNYKFTLSDIYPLINRFEAQRRFLDAKFYERLERDILNGCLMPPLTIAFVVDDINQYNSASKIEKHVNENLSKGYILDGIQRLNALKRVESKMSQEISNKEIFFTVIISQNKDLLLYRMITINNGQRPMTPRHQIEILTQELFDLDGFKIKIQSEKQKSENPIKDSFKLSDIAKGYMAFLTRNVHNENAKIIEEKMDQILVGRLMEADIGTYELQFIDVIKLVDKLSDNTGIRDWLQVANNLIGFCVGINSSYKYITKLKSNEIEKALQIFDKAFLAINPSKVNVGKVRRELTKYFIENAESTFLQDEYSLIESFSEIMA